MERFDPAAANHTHYLKGFGEIALAVALGRGRTAGAREMFAGDPGAQRAAAAQDQTAAGRYMKGAIAMTDDPGLSDWMPFSQAFTHEAVAASILGRIPRTHPVAFNRGQIPQTVFGTASWVGEGQPKPVEIVSFGHFSVPPRKVAVIAVLSMEALKLPGADGLLRTYLQNAVGEKIDATLVSSDAEVSGESPAGLGADAMHVASTGSTAAAIAADLRSMIDAMSGRVPLNACCWILSPQAWALFQLLKVADAGGTLAGFPVLSSSAADGTVMLLAASYLSVASDGPVTINASQHADVTVPDEGNTSGERKVGLWQANLVALRAESWINWSLAGPVDSNGTAACVVLTGASYA